MTFKPAHKQDNPDLKPGQIVYGFDRYPYLKSSSIAEPVAKPKLTFDEWYALNEINTHSRTEHECMKMAWNAAQDNK